MVYTGSMSKNLGGRPSTSEEDKERIFHKLTPYLKAGLSLPKACREAKIPVSTVYKLRDEDPGFMEQIEASKQFISVLVSNANIRILEKVITRIEDAGSFEELPKAMLDFLKWFATNSNATREEFSERKDIGLFDPAAEIAKVAKMIDESSE